MPGTSSRLTRHLFPLIAPLIAVVWLSGSLLGFSWLMQTASVPGAQGPTQAIWPPQSELSPDSNRANLVLALHPHCPCSRATVSELARIMASCRSEVTAHVLFMRPPGFPDGWEESDLWRMTAAIPGVNNYADAEGAEARRFGAETSGHVTLFDRNQHLVYRGGITLARGHAGDNEQQQAVLSLLKTGRSSSNEGRVYGCPLLSTRDEALRAGGGEADSR